MRRSAPPRPGREGFTLIELVIFTGVFALTVASFLTVLVAMTKVQVRQSGAAEVNQQSQFLLQTIQRYVEQSSLVELAKDTATTTLKLRMASSSYDPTLIFASGTALWIQEGASAAQVLTSPKVTISNLAFTKHENPGGHDSVSVVFTANYNSPNAANNFAQSLTTSVARVSAATFDSNIAPSVGNTYKIGSSTADWRSINNTIFFNASSVGVGVPNPGETLEVNGGMRLNTGTSKPTCGSSHRGTLWVTASASGTTDRAEVCVKDASNAYAWQPVSNGLGSGFTVDTGGTLSTSLVAYWKLDEASGSRADSKGTNTLTDVNTVTSNTGKQGTAAQFVKTNSEQLSIADNAALSTGDIDFTLAGWVYFDNVTGELPVAGKYDSGTAEYLIYYYSGAWRFSLWDSSGTSVIGEAAQAATPTTGTWYFVVGWHDAANNQVGISVNGTVTTSTTTGAASDNSSAFRVGRDDRNATYLSGRVDELGLWKKVLSATERADLYNGGNGNTYNP